MGTIHVLFALTSHFSLQLWQVYYTCLVCSNTTLLTATMARLLYMSCLLKHNTSAHCNCGRVSIHVLFALTSHFCSMQLWQGYYTCLVCFNIALLLTATMARLLYMSCLLKHNTSAHCNCGRVSIHVLFALTSHFCSMQLWQGYYTCLVCSSITLLLTATMARLQYMSCLL